MIVITAHEVQRASRLGHERIAGRSLAWLLVARPEWWTPGFVELKLPAARTLARVENAARRREAEALTASPVLVGELVEEKSKTKNTRAVGTRRRPRALPAAR